MTVPSTISRMDYVGNGATSEYDFTFRIFTEDDLLVTTRDTDGVETTLALTTDYTVDIADDAADGGTITLVAGALDSDIALTIRRVRELTQQTDVRNQGPYHAEIHEDAFDHLLMILQQQQDELNRSLRLQETEAGTALLRTLPSLVDRANQFLAFDANGNPIAAAGVAGGTPVSAYSATLLAQTTAAAWRTLLEISLANLGVSAFIETLLNDADAATARATLGVNLTNLGVSAYIQTLLDDADASAAQSTLGISAFIKTLLDDANAGAALSTLGVSAFIQTLLNDADQATAQATLGISNLFGVTQLEQTAPFALGIAGDTLVTGLTITAAAGTYEVSFEGQIDTPGAGGNQTISLYKDGVQLPNTERTVSISNTFMCIGTGTKVSVNGSQAIDVRLANTSGTATLQKRRLKMQAIAP